MLIIKAELKKLMGDYKNYWFNYLFGNITLFVLAAGLFWAFAGQNQNHSGSMVIFLFGLFFWYFSGDALGMTSQMIFEELMLGTFEQLLMTTSSIKKIIWSRLFVQFLLRSLFAVVFFTTLISVFGMWPALGALGSKLFLLLIVFLIGVIGLYGMGFVVAGLALVFKQAGSIVGILSYFVLFFTGTVVEFELLPTVIKPIAYLFPVTFANKLMRELALPLGKATFSSILQNKSFWLLIANTLIWLFVGQLIFNKAMQLAKKKGNLGSYYL